MMTLAQKRVIIMGGTSGIGLATAQLLADVEAKVVITGRNQEKLSHALATLPATAQGFVVDSTSVEALTTFYEQIGAFDHLVIALSGKSGAGPFADLGVQRLRQAFEAKFFAHFQSAQLSLPTLNSTGSIVFISAASARTSLAGTVGLAAINGAIEAMLAPLALELKPIRVNAVSPGVIRTAWWDTMPTEQREAIFAHTATTLPVGRVGEAADVAEAILFLLDNGFITGSVIECDGGLRIK